MLVHSLSSIRVWGFLLASVTRAHYRQTVTVVAPLLMGFILTACEASHHSDQVSTERIVASPKSDRRNPSKNAYFGDTHVHTRYSFDASAFGTLATPDDAYSFAKGNTIFHPSGTVMKLAKPLDFLAITDHAEYLNAATSATMASHHGAQFEVIKTLRRIAECWTEACDPPPITTVIDAAQLFRDMGVYLASMREDSDKIDLLNNQSAVSEGWKNIIESAEQHNSPYTFTTLIGYEYTANGPSGGNLHRNVLFGSSRVPDSPFSHLNSANPEDLWRWMDSQREAGIALLAIPHNSNGSDGWMFQTTRFDGSPQNAQYARLRMRNEPIVEITQSKGTSDSHPSLSPNDEWSDFEIMPYLVGRSKPSRASGSYVRDAFGRGIQFQDSEGFNPFKFGVVGSSDTHTGGGSFNEGNYWSKAGVLDILPKQRGSVPLKDADDWNRLKTIIFDIDAEPFHAPDGRIYANTVMHSWGASGLAGVWAESNTREDIFNALGRKEVFGTSGPRIKLRFFASAEFADTALDDNDIIQQAYAVGVPMGGDIGDTETSPQFLAWAASDPDSELLQRLQIIKGWIDGGVYKERVYDIACGDNGQPNLVTQRCSELRDDIDLETCSTAASVGKAELKALWRDPDFSANQHAFYYVRALEIPKCRWSTWDAVRAGIAPRADLATVIQDRAWSSPIWYRPL